MFVTTSHPGSDPSAAVRPVEGCALGVDGHGGLNAGCIGLREPSVIDGVEIGSPGHDGRDAALGELVELVGRQLVAVVVGIHGDLDDVAERDDAACRLDLGDEMVLESLGAEDVELDVRAEVDLDVSVVRCSITDVNLVNVDL